MFQDFDTQLVSTNVETELRYPLEYGHGLKAFEDAEMVQSRIADMLDQVGLAGLQRRDPLTLSGGQRQRLVMGSVLIRQPGILVLDQPLTDLDPVGRRVFLEVLSDLQSRGITVVWAEHDCEGLLGVDEVCVLDQGRIGWQGAARTFLRQPEIARTYGVRPHPLAECFEAWDVSTLPITVDEAWRLMEDRGLKLDPPPSLRPTPASRDPQRGIPGLLS